MTFPFEVPFAEVEADLDGFAAVVIDSLESDFLILPKGPGFVEFPAFEDAYEQIKRATQGFQDFDPDAVLAAALERPIRESSLPAPDTPLPQGTYRTGVPPVGKTTSRSRVAATESKKR